MIILIGGNGFVGSAYARVLRAMGQEVVVVEKDDYASHIGAECDVLINANGNSRKFFSREHPKEDFQASVASVRNSLVDFKYKKYVFLSTSDVYPDCSDPALTREELSLDIAKQSPYGFHKYLAEQCVRHVAKDWLIIRQGGFVGPGLKKNAVYDSLFGDRLWVHPDSAFQFIGTDTSAGLVWELVSKGVSGEVFNLTAQGTIPVRDIMALAGRQVPADETVPVVRYEISTDKAAKTLALPGTRGEVEAFIKSVK
ncbi:MAG: NAD-dependent epimerase/dehydratase family protein [Alphaproteobacteria bacterium]|nr:NAD-dependent epimerase/dehydratase family protein [Alphaproteobacteria bacterium]